jgi:hypothetical protein
MNASKDIPNGIMGWCVHSPPPNGTLEKVYSQLIYKLTTCATGQSTSSMGEAKLSV